MIKKIFIFLFLVSSAHATTRYVGKAGSDANSCATSATEATPKLSVNAGLSCAAAGDTVIIKAGTYVESINNNIASGTAGNVITIQGKTGDTVTLAPTASSAFGILLTNKRYIRITNIIFNGVNVSGTSIDGAKFDSSSTSLATASDHIEVDHCEFTNWDNQGFTIAKYVNNINFHDNHVHHNGDALPTLNQDHGMYIRGTDNIIEKNEIDHMAYGAGIQLYDDTAATSSIARNIIRKNNIHDNRLCGTFNYTSQTLIYDNICRASTVNGGFNFRYGVPSGDKIYNNTFYTGGAWTSSGFGALYIDSGAQNLIVRNNLFFGGSTSEQITNLGSNTTFSNNWCGLAGTGCMASPAIGDPKFVSTTDFHLQSISPVIDRGTTLSEVTDDYDSASRPQGSAYDPGAFEYLASAPTPTVTVLSPNGGESFEIGTTQTVLWSTTGGSGNIDIDEDQDGDGTYETTVVHGTSNDGVHSYTVSGSAGSSRKMKVKFASLAQFDVSDAVYSTSVTVTSSITFTSPIAGQRFRYGQIVPFSWTSIGVSGKIDIYVSYNNGTYYEPTPVVANWPFDQPQATWTSKGSSTAAKFKIVSQNNTSIFGVSGAVKLGGKTSKRR